MMVHRKLARTLSGLLAVLGLVCAAEFRAGATPPSGLAFTLIGRATVPEFDVRRRFRLPSEDKIDGEHKDADGKKFWKVELEASQPIDVATQIVTFQPGGSSGWHTHPGPVIFTIKTGTLTVYEGDDPSCTPVVFPAGTGTVEAATNTHIHMVRNETSNIAEALVTYLVPTGVPTRTDLPNPGNCPF
jgi:hypothetical protein